MFLGLVLAAVAALPQPCTSATLDCAEWIKPVGQPLRLLIYRTHPLETRNEHVTRAFVFVHGILRDADNHFRTALAAAFLANRLDDTMIVARPHRRTAMHFHQNVDLRHSNSGLARAIGAASLSTSPQIASSFQLRPSIIQTRIVR